MVNINDVYLTVQAISNKEQRGFIAPVEFNKFARQAQDEIFESYFYDLPHFKLNRKGSSAMSPSDIKKNIKEKIDIFSEIGDCTYNSTTKRFALPVDSMGNDLSYRLGSVYYQDGTNMRQVDQMDKSKLQYILSSRLTAPSLTFPKYIRLDNDFSIYPLEVRDADDVVTTIGVVDNVSVHYIKRPSDPIWAFISVNNDRTPIHNAGLSTNFEVHSSERYLLVEKILQYVGIQIKQPEITQFASQDEVSDNQNKKS